MATKSGMLANLRLEMSDIKQSFEDVQFGDGIRSRFELPVEALADLAVKVDGTTKVSGTDYIADLENGLVVFVVTPIDGARVVFSGNHSGLFTDAQLSHFLDTAMALHDVNRHPRLTYANIEPSEEYLVRLLARHEALWVLATDASYDIDILTVEGVRVPRSQRYQQLMSLLQGVKMRYDELAANLNLGPGRIEQYSLRRVSRTTGRLVSIYLDREVDDHTMPVRIFPSQDTQGANLPDRTVGAYNIQVYQGEPWRETFTFTDDQNVAIDLSAHEFVAKVAHSRYTTGDYVSFTIISTDAALGKVTLELPGTVTENFTVNQEYFWTFKWWDAAGVPNTVVEGILVVESDRPSYIEQPD